MSDRKAILYGAIFGTYIGFGVNYLTGLWGHHWWLGLAFLGLSPYWYVVFDVENYGNPS